MLTIVSFVLVMGIIVLVHEIGHFVAARRNGIVVEEFGIGMPPRVLKLAERNGTIYSLNAIPLGGFVRMRGEDDPTQPGSFAAASRKARAVVLLAGVFMNFALAILLFTAQTAIRGVPDTANPGTIVEQVSADSPAALAGLQPGDRIVAANGEPLANAVALQDFTQRHLGETVEYTVARGETTVTLKMAPRANPPEGQGALGILIGESLRKPTVLEALWGGVRQTGEIIWLTVSLPVVLLSQGQSLGDLGFMGPVGIAATTGEVVRSAAAADTLLPIIWFTGLLSVAIGFTNLLPIPGLDGGRLIFVIVEAVRGKRVEPAQEGMIHLLGIGILLILVGLITVREVISLLNGTFPTLNGGP